MARAGTNHKGGRPKGSVSVATRLKISAKEQFSSIVEANIVPIAEALLSRALDKDTNAARELLDRAWGKSKQSVDIDAKVSFPEPSEKIKELAQKLKESI